MNITFVQTADPIFYYPMLVQTSRTVRQYCIRNGLNYESYIGIKRGSLPWQAAYNRVYILKEMLDRGMTGWVFYADADALIADQDFDLRAYLRERNHYAGVFSGYMNNTNPVKYEINSGGFAVNLSHPWGRAFVLDYWHAVDSIPDADFNNALIWEKDIPEDQWILYHILRDYVEFKNCGDTFLFERANEGFTNHGPFIKQRLRSQFSGFRQRITMIRQEVDGILYGRRDARCDDGPGVYIPASHPRMITSCGEKQASCICATGEGGMLLYGPYVDLAAGDYVLRLFGEARGSATSPVHLTSDVISEFGEATWSERSTTIDHAIKGQLLEHRLALPRDVTKLEVRLSIGQGDAVSIHALHVFRPEDA